MYHQRSSHLPNFLDRPARVIVFRERYGGPARIKAKFQDMPGEGFHPFGGKVSKRFRESVRLPPTNYATVIWSDGFPARLEVQADQVEMATVGT